MSKPRSTIRIVAIVVFAALLAASATAQENTASNPEEFDTYLYHSYNLVSWPFVLPPDISTQSVFADSTGTGCQLTGGYPAGASDQVKFFDCSDDSWYTAWYKVGGPGESDVWKGDLTTIESDKSYWIIIQYDHPEVTLTMSGTVSDTNRIVPVCAGSTCNFVGSCFPVPRHLEDANLLSSGFTGGYPAGRSDMMRYYDASNHTWYTAWYKVGGPGENNIWRGRLSASQTDGQPYLEPGNGYRLEARGAFIDDQWVYPPPAE